MASDRMKRVLLSTLAAEDGMGVVRVEDRYDTDIDDLWSAITEPARLARWWGEVEARWDELVPPYQELAANIDAG